MTENFVLLIFFITNNLYFCILTFFNTSHIQNKLNEIELLLKTLEEKT